MIESTDVPPWLAEKVRVRLRRKVERSADIQIPAGETGTVAVVDLEYDLVTVRLDTHYPGLDDWDNELAWFERDLIAELSEDLELIDGDAGTAEEPARPTHRELYPEQYEHPLCGRRVRVSNATYEDRPVEGTVQRVVTSQRWGDLAILEEYPNDHAWSVAKCIPMEDA